MQRVTQDNLLILSAGVVRLGTELPVARISNRRLQAVFAVTLTHAERVEHFRNEVRRLIGDLNISVAEYAMLNHIHYGCHRPRHLLAKFAASPDYALGESLTAKEASLAVRSCFKRGLLRVISEVDVESFERELLTEGYRGPIYRFPPVGGVDFTDRGAEVWLAIEKFERDNCAEWPPRGFAYLDTVEMKTQWIFVSRAGMNLHRRRLRKEIDALEVTAPTRLDQVRLAPWSPPMTGWSFDATERYQWQGRGGGGGSFLNWDATISELDRSAMRRECRRSRITLRELSILMSIADWGAKSARETVRFALAFAKHKLNVRASRETILAALRSCLQRQLVVRLTADEVQSMDSKAGTNGSSLVSRDHRPNSINLSKTGETLLVENGPRILGSAWLDGWSVSREIFRREHRYARNLRDVASVFEEYAVKTRERVQIRSIDEIGPWCVYWWKRFPKGYRIELEITHGDVES